jgi:hypothetical protein
MSLGFEITQDDVLNVLKSHQSSKSFIEKNIDDIMSMIDDDEILSAVFAYDYDEYKTDEEILTDQTEIAYNEIAKQLYELNYITKEQIEKFGNKNIIFE